MPKPFLWYCSLTRRCHLWVIKSSPWTFISCKLLKATWSAFFSFLVYACFRTICCPPMVIHIKGDSWYLQLPDSQQLLIRTERWCWCSFTSAWTPLRALFCHAQGTSPSRSMSVIPLGAGSLTEDTWNLPASQGFSRDCRPCIISECLKCYRNKLSKWMKSMKNTNAALTSINLQFWS